MRMATPRGSPERRCAMPAASTATAHATEPSPMITSAAMTLRLNRVVSITSLHTFIRLCVRRRFHIVTPAEWIVDCGDAQ